MALAAGIGAIGNIAGGMISNAVGAASSKKLARYQAALNYYYAKKSALNSPTWNRTGLQDAGYNPMLAVQNSTSGANSSWTSASGVGSPDFGNLGTDAITNAQSFQRLKNETAVADSTVEMNSANAGKANAEKQSLLEKLPFVSRREKAEINNIEKDTLKKESEINNIDKTTEYIEKNYELQKMLGNRGLDVQSYNAETARNNYLLDLDKFEAGGDQWMKEWMEKHPHLYGIYRHLDNTAALAGRVFGAMPNFSDSSQYHDYETHSVRYDKHGNIIGQQSVKHHSNRGSKKRSKR